MKKFLLSCTLLATALIANAAVGDDITSKYLQNADFSQGTPVVGYICTYDYDMEKNATNMYGQQNVEGWTNVTPSDNTFIDGRTDGLNARAAGIFAIGKYDEETGEPQALLGGQYHSPDENSTGGTDGNTLAMVAVWGAQVQYTQAATLPAGAYTMKFTIFNNAGTTAVNQNLFGFIADNGTSYTVSKKSWTDDWTWCVDEVTFILTEETSGVISVGYSAANAGSAAMPHLFLESVQIIEADPAEIDRQEAEKLKPQLLELLEAGDKMGVSTTAGWAVYNNENATLAQVQTAIENQKEINAANMTDFTDFFINNAHFTLGDPLDNGICTYAKDMEANQTTYFGMQDVLDWIPNDKGTDGKAAGLFPVGGGVKNVSGNDSTWLGSRNAGFTPPATKANGSTEGNVFGFVSCWTFKAYYYQAVTLPAGSYTITIPTYNATGGTQAIAKNLCGFIANDGTEYLATTTVFTPTNEWKDETIKFTLEEETSGIITIGYEAANTGSGNQPHLFIDEFTLMFNGKTDVDPSLIALNGAIRSGESLLAAGDVFETAIGEKLEEVLEAARVLKDAGSDDVAANTAAATEVNNAVQALRSSIATYAKFFDFLTGKYYDTMEKYEGTEMEDFAFELGDSLLEYDDAYSEGTLTSDEINAIIDGFDAKERAAIQAVLDKIGTDGEEHELDITLLFQNVNFANKSVAGWTSSVSSGKFESQQNGVCEVWSAEAVNFNAYTTLANLPAGIYEITAPGWFRAAGDGAPGYDAYVAGTETGTSYLYANGNKTKLLSQYVDQLFADAEDNMHNLELAPGFTPNGQSQAQAIFYASDIDVNNTVVTGLTEPGDLTIGFMGEGFESGTWTVWGEMKIVYKGQNDEVLALCLNDEITALVEEAAAMVEDENIYNVEETVDNLCNAIEQGEGAVEASSIEEKTAAVAALKEAIACGNETTSLMNQLANVVVVYETLLGNSELDSQSTELENLLEEANPDNGIKNNEQIQSMLSAFSTAWTKFVCGQTGMAEATEESPVDVTDAILNADFSGVDGATPGAAYWTRTKDGGNEGVEFDIYEFYNTGAFDISQTLQGLTPGFYRVSVQSFYRAGSNEANVATYTENHDSLNTVKLYANNDSVVIKNVLELIDCENADTMYIAGSPLGVNGEVTVNFNDNPTYYVPNNRESMFTYNELGQYWNEIIVEVGEDGTLKFGLNKQVGLSTDWCPFDNFKLEYLGATEPAVGIESVKVAETLNANDAIYDLQGRKVSTPVKGLYIINRKVVLVK